MKSFVITIKSIDRSFNVAKRCIESMPEHDIQMFDAITPKNDPFKMMIDKKIPIEKFKEEYSYLESCVSAFLSHHTLWEMCAEDNEEYMIFEHDAVAVGTVPMLMSYDKVISLGKPSYGKFNTPNFFGPGPLTSKPYFPGAHAYRMKPSGARLLIEKAKTSASPTDLFLSTVNFPWLEEFYPWPVEARDNFSTIQRTRGCLAKHSWNDQYELIR